MVNPFATLLTLAAAIAAAAACYRLATPRGRRLAALTGLVFGVFGLALVWLIRRRPPDTDRTSWRHPAVLLSLLSAALVVLAAAVADA